MNQSSRRFQGFQWRTFTIFIGVFAFALSLNDPAWSRKTRHRPAYPVIRDILVHPKNIFDPAIPGEDSWPYRVANMLHITTREKIVRRELLVEPGKPADKDLLDESERILRRLPFIKDARIKTVPVGDGRVDVIVETHDTWTTEPQVNFGREGEQNRFSAGMVEENVLGYGKSFSYFYTDDQDGVNHEYGYKDPQVFGTRVQLDSLYKDTPTGNQQKFTIARPFFSLTTQYAGGATWNHYDRLQDVTTNGTRSNEYRRQHHDVDAFVGTLLNEDPDSVHRLSLHYLHTMDRFNGTAQTLPNTLPVNKTMAGPSPRWDWVQSRFIKETFIDRAERVEDINLGHQMELSAGYSARALGASYGAVPFTFSDQFGLGKEGGSLALFSLGTVGNFNTYGAPQEAGKLANTLYFFNANYYRHLPTEFPFTAVLHAESAYVQRIDPENQLELGGDTGLRGFKAKSFTGNKSTLLNLEGRAFYPHEVLHVAYLGGACFVDAGQVQPDGTPYAFKDVRASVGVGLRIALTRSAAGSVYRFDVAYAIGPLNQDKRIVFSIAGGQGFKRNANAFAKFPFLPITQN